MNSNIAAICILVKRNIGERCSITFLTNVSWKALRDCLECANIYKGNSSKKRTELVEMIVYGCINGKLSEKQIEDISMKQQNLNLKQENSLSVKSLPGYGNAGLRKKEIKSLIKEKIFIKVWYYFS